MAATRADDEQLIRRYQAGDEEAFASLFEGCSSLLSARIGERLGRKLGRRVSVDDVLQETRIIAYRRHADFIGESCADLQRWWIGIAENRVRRVVALHGRAEIRSVGREVSRDARPATALFRGNGPTPSEEAIGEETQEMVLRALCSLPADYAEVLRLVRVEGVDFEEAARRMKRSYHAVNKLHGRALLRFTEIFQQMTRDDHEES